jgi:hypothetical protein
MGAWRAQARAERDSAEKGARAEGVQLEEVWAAHAAKLRQSVMRAPLKAPWVPQMVHHNSVAVPPSVGGRHGAAGVGMGSCGFVPAHAYGNGGGGSGGGSGGGGGESGTYYMNTRTGRVQKEHPHTHTAEKLVREQRQRAEEEFLGRIHRIRQYVGRVEDGEREQRVASLRALGFVSGWMAC